MSALRNGYSPIKDLQTSGTGLMGRALAAHWVRFENTSVFAADSERLYLKSGTAWMDKSKGGTAYSPAASRWQFANFGPHVVAVAKNIRPQRYNVATAMTSTTFDDLPNSPASAAAVGAVRDFLVMGNIEGRGENYVQWSGFNNVEQWTSSLETQSDFQPLPGDGGPVHAIVSGSTGFIFRERSIHSMEYIGPRPIFRFDNEFGVNRGTEAPLSIAKLGSIIYYLDFAGFFTLDTRNKMFKPIGHNRVDQYVRDNTTPECLKDAQATVDPLNKQIIWSMCTNTGQAFNDLQMVYNYALDRWTVWRINNELMALLPTTGVTLEQLDSLVGSNIDTHTVSLDSDTYAGGSFTLSAFDTSHVLGTFSGDYLEAEIETGEFWTQNNKRILTKQQRIFVDGHESTEVECFIHRRETTSHQIERTPPSLQDQHGNCHASARHKFVSLGVTIRNGFTNCTGLDWYKRIA